MKARVPTSPLHVQTANICIEVATDIILSTAFMYKLASGLKMDANSVITLLTSDKILKLIVGWSFGIAAAAASNLSKADFAWLCE